MFYADFHGLTLAEFEVGRKVLVALLQLRDPFSIYLPDNYHTKFNLDHDFTTQDSICFCIMFPKE